MAKTACNTLITKFIPMAAIFLLQTQEGTAQYIGAVRCYVCKGHVYPGTTYASCRDIYNTTQTTITYCAACIKYEGILTIGNSSTQHGTKDSGETVRACYDDKSYNAANNGVFQLSGLKDATTEMMTVQKQMTPVAVHTTGERKSAVNYGPGILYICNDGDLCNAGNQDRVYFAVIWAASIWCLILTL